ncbi:MAG: HEAT repeat domain-containing protein [Aggregatilineales bacterium]
MTTTKQLLKQLKDRDPAKRLSAIKALARDKERQALQQLARMAGDDKDAEVRQMARKAGSYILAQTGGLGADTATTSAASISSPPPKMVDDKGKFIKVKVSDEDKAKASAFLEEAMSYQINGNRAKTLRSLAKALVIDPNMRDDSFFTSLAEDATGMEGEEAIQQLYDEGTHKRVNQAVHESRLQKRVDEHSEETSKATWADVVFDMGLYFVISTVAAIILGFIITQSAQGYIDGIETNWSNVSIATRVVNPDDSTDVRYWLERDEEGDPIYFKQAYPDMTFFANAQQIAATTVATILMASAGFGLASTFLLGLMNGVVHLVAAKMLSGVGRSPYLMHKVTGLFINRTIILGILVGIASLVIFGSGGGMVMQIFAGVIGLVLLLVLFKLISTVGQAYDFGFMKGMMATSAGSMVVAVIVGLGVVFLA